MTRVFTLIAFLAYGLSLNIRGESEVSNTPITDATATGTWLQTLFTVSDGEIRFCKKPLEQTDKARIPVAAKSEIQIRGRGILINQDGLYPMCLGSADSGISVYMGSPFYAFLDYADGLSGLEGYAKNPKEAAMNNAGFRVIGEALHSHFAKLAGDKPEWHRVIDDIRYPSEHYIWKIGDIWIILSAYNGNDNNSISIDLTKDNKKVERIRAMKPTNIAVYPDWGDPLPHKEGEQAGTVQPATRPESKSEGSVKPQPESVPAPR